MTMGSVTADLERTERRGSSGWIDVRYGVKGGSIGTRVPACVDKNAGVEEKHLESVA